jgi:DNA-binding Lrp family transcriptional regulator
VIIVSNEVGMGIVPDSALGRTFRDLQGWLNQDLAAIADEAGHSENKVRRDLRRREELGLITVMRPNVTRERAAAGRTGS